MDLQDKLELYKKIILGEKLDNSADSDAIASAPSQIATNPSAQVSVAVHDSAVPVTQNQGNSPTPELQEAQDEEGETKSSSTDQSTSPTNLAIISPQPSAANPPAIQPNTSASNLPNPGNGLTGDSLMKRYQEYQDKLLASSKDYNQQLAEARDRENNYKLMTGLAQGAGQFGAGLASTGGAGPVTYDPSTLQKMQAAFQPVAAVKEQMTTDLGSQQSALDRYLKMANEQRQIQQGAERMQLLNQRNQLENKKIGVMQEGIASKERIATVAKQFASDQHEQTQISSGLTDLLNRVDKHKTPEMIQSMGNIQNTLAASGVDLNHLPDKKTNPQGYNLLERQLPGFLQTEQGAKLRSEVQDLINYKAHSLYGSRLTQTEIDQLDKAMGTGKGGAEGLLLTYLADTRNGMLNTAKHDEARFSVIPKLKQAYTQAVGEPESSKVQKLFGSTSSGTTALNINGQVMNIKNEQVQKYLDQGATRAQ